MVMKKFYYSERNRQQQLLDDGFFNDDPGNGCFMGKVYPFILKDGLNNIYSPILDDALGYFRDNNIKWWGGKRPTGHILSSQIACVNHLMPFRKDKDAVLKILKGIDFRFVDVLPIPSDKDESYIAFEAVSDNDHLNERQVSRGHNCTSVDALILGLDNEGKVWLIPIEWKYTESYSDSPSNDKSAEKEGKGEERMSRYNSLIENSEQLKSLSEYKSSIYFFEPFYQLMRQTLWAEQMIDCKDSESIKAANFMHVHVIPEKDTDLLNKRYRLSQKGMEATWREMLADQSKYLVIDPATLLAPVININPELKEYLEKRYWAD